MNSRKDRSDPTLMLSILALAVALSIWRAVSNIPADRLAVISGWVFPTALGLTVIASALATQRLISTRRTLRHRTAVAVVPADEFDASPEAVARFAGQLGQMDRGVRGWLDRRARALRIRLESDREGRLVYLLETPAHAAALLRSSLGSYDGVELRDPETLLGPSADARDGTTLRTELVLARPSVEPLAHLAFDPDPLQPFAAAMAGTGDGEEVSVCVDLLPARGRRRSRLGRRLRRQAKRLGTEHVPLGDRLGLSDRKPREIDPATAAERRQRGRGLDAKLRDGGQPFETQILLRVRAAQRYRARAIMQNLLASFESLADRNWLKASGLPIPGLAFLGSDLPLRRARFDRRLETGLFRPARQNVLTVRELAGFLKPPTVFCQSDNVARSGAKLSPPPDLPEPTPDNRDVIPLGRVTDETGDRTIGFRTADTFFSYVAGRSRYGKTELAICQFLHLVRNGHGGLFLDPHADALERMRPYLDAPDVRERVVEINLGAGHTGRQPGWNLFELGGQDAGEAEARVEAVVDAFASAMQWGERSTRALNLTTQSAAALAAIAQVLPADTCPTIFQLPTLLSDEKWRAVVLPFLPTASQQFWLDRFPRLSIEAITPLTNMVDRLRASAAITELLGASRSTYRVREAMDEGKIVLACPGSGGTRDRLVANLLVFDLLHAVKGRANLPPAARRPFWVFLDEVQTYDGASSGNLAALLEQSAKYGMRAFLLNQNPERLSADTLNALTTNRSHLITTALNSHAAGLITREWGGTPDPAALTSLPKYRFVAQVTHQGEPSKPFALAGVSVEETFGPPPNPNTTIRETESIDDPAGHVAVDLETLDDRIYAKLRELTPATGSSERGYAPISATDKREPR